MKKLPENAGVLACLPDELHYLIEPALRLGLGSEGAIFEFLDQAKKGQMNELTSLARRVLENKHYPLVLQFIRRYPFPKHQESANLYFFFGALDYAELKFD